MVELQILQDSFGCQAGRFQDRRKTGARVGACADEIKVPVPRVAIVGSKISHLEDSVGQTMGRAFGQVIAA